MTQEKEIISYDVEHLTPNDQEINHNLTLQLFDGYGIPVAGTMFTITLKILKHEKKVTLQLPAIGFQIGPSSNYGANIPTNGPYPPVPPSPPGGYLYTSCGRLPKDICPCEIIDRSWLAPSDTGVLTGFSFTQDLDDYPTPPSGYIVKITNQGDLVVQCAGTFGNTIPPGNHTLLPTNITYLSGKLGHLMNNVVLSTGFTRTNISGPFTLNDGVRDSHVNDAFDGVFAWSWTDNSMLENQALPIINTMVVIGKLKNGQLKVRKPIQLTHYRPNVIA